MFRAYRPPLTAQVPIGQKPAWLPRWAFADSALNKMGDAAMMATVRILNILLSQWLYQKFSALRSNDKSC
jgi:hypothetical protein